MFYLDNGEASQARWDDEKPPPSPSEGGVIVEVISGNDLYPNVFPLLLLPLKGLGTVLALKLIIL